MTTSKAFDFLEFLLKFASFSLQKKEMFHAVPLTLIAYARFTCMCSNFLNFMTILFISSKNWNNSNGGDLMKVVGNPFLRRNHKFSFQNNNFQLQTKKCQNTKTLQLRHYLPWQICK